MRLPLRCGVILVPEVWILVAGLLCAILTGVALAWLMRWSERHGEIV